MYENTSNSIDWKGIFLKVVIAFLIVLIAVTGYKTLKGNKNNAKEETNIVESNSNATFTANIEKLKQAGETYYNSNKDKVPTTEGITSMVTLNELISNGVITNLTDVDGKTCDGESSYVTATKNDNKTTIKANLVCGDSYSYVTAYLGENDSKEETKETVTSSTSDKKVTSTVTTNTSNNTSKNTNSTCTTNCTPSVSVSTKTEVNNNVSIGKDKNTSSSNTVSSNNSNTSSNNTNNSNTNNVVYKNNYLVEFDEGTGSCYYRDRYVTEGNTVAYPGDCDKNNYDFIGWYLNGSKYNFNTPVTRDITLVAKYGKDYGNTSNNNKYNSGEDTFVTYVYSMGWDTKGTDYMEITHTLRLPEDKIDDLEDDNNIEITDIRIKDIDFYKSLNTKSLLDNYYDKHDETFIYKANGWEYNGFNYNTLATIKSNSVDFNFRESSRYKDIYDAEDEGFEVTWEADNVYKQCSIPFSVNGRSNLCNYGIVYKVIWEYQYEY